VRHLLVFSNRPCDMRAILTVCTGMENI
jgi:hypothetical protein